MSLLRLLSAGKSLVGLKQASARYDLSSRGSLPRFEAKKNPFRDKSGQNPQVPDKAQKESQPTSPMPQESAQVAPLSRPAISPGAKREGGIKKAFAMFGDLLRRRESKTKNTVAVRGGSGFVQGELSLESVRVVRNDLSDSDLEVVPAHCARRRRAEDESLSGQLPQNGAVTGQPNLLAGGTSAKRAGSPSVGLRGSASAFVGRLFGAGKI